MTNLKKETQKVEGSINVLKSELEVLNKNGIKEQINNDKKTINLLEDLLENSNIQKSYPKYNKLKKLFYILPSALVTLLTVILIISSILIGNVTYTAFLPLILLAADYVTYFAATKVFDKKISENEKYKPYYELYGDKEYSAKRALKDLREKENDLSNNKLLLDECNNKEQKIVKLEEILNKLYAIRDNYIEQTLGEKYKEEIDELSIQIEQENPKVLKKNK